MVLGPNLTVRFRSRDLQALKSAGPPARASPTQQPQGGVGEVFGGGRGLAAWAREAGTKGRPPEQGRGPP